MTLSTFDIETVPGDLRRVEEDRKEVKEGLKVSRPSLTKPELCSQIDPADPNLMDLKADELKDLWVEVNRDRIAEEQYRKRSFDGSKGRILSWAFYDSQNDQMHSCLDGVNERYVLESFVETIHKVHGRKDGSTKPYFIAHNATFDLKFMFQRLVLNGINPRFPIPFGGWHGRDYFCTSQAWTGDKNNRISLKNLCALFGFEGKPDDIDGSKVFDHALAGDFERIEEYNRDDVTTCFECYKRLTFC